MIWSHEALRAAEVSGSPPTVKFTAWARSAPEPRGTLVKLPPLGVLARWCRVSESSTVARAHELLAGSSDRRVLAAQVVLKRGLVCRCADKQGERLDDHATYVYLAVTAGSATAGGRSVCESCGIVFKGSRAETCRPCRRSLERPAPEGAQDGVVQIAMSSFLPLHESPFRACRGCGHLFPFARVDQLHCSERCRVRALRQRAVRPYVTPA